MQDYLQESAFSCIDIISNILQVLARRFYMGGRQAGREGGREGAMDGGYCENYNVATGCTCCVQLL